MANTEGMTDEVMNSLLLNGDDPAASGPPARPPSRGGPSAFLQRRMDMPMGERPAAIVTRRSKNRKSPKVTTVEEEEKPEQPEAAPPVMSEIVERPIGSRASTNGKSGGKSLFAQQQRRKPQLNGFPSVQKPIGTYAKRSSKATKQAVAAVVPKSLEQRVPTASNDEKGIDRESGAMLSQMSQQEIQEKVQDLQSAMSPEMLAFLRKRGKAKKGAGAAIVEQPKKQASVKATSEPAEILDDVEEKERLATVMSSIRTYNDMDDAYEKEVGLHDESNLLSAKSEWDQACSLLRSTAPRQTLWAARIVCNYLERDLKEGKRFSIGSDGDKPADWPYPSLLPVSLRCLLDASASHTNELSLHSYVLRSFYALLQLRAPVDHLVDVVDSENSIDKIYQQVFLEDALPTAPFGSLYPSIAATPMAVDGSTVAYATGSSSTSAQQDGEAFKKDPMWTLLSKMRIVPRVAQLLKSHFVLPEEGLVAICGILSMLSVRSPGAASAIAQHGTLLQSLLRKTVIPPFDDSDSHFLNAEVMLPVMIQLNAMARQSRVVAATIPYLDILPAILGTDVGNDERLLEVQKWALILWRKLLRYGMGFVGLESLVSLSIMNLGEKSGLAREYCSVFSAWLDCAKVFQKSVDKLKSSIGTNDQEVLSNTISWLTPSIRLCAERLNVDSTDVSLCLQGSMMRMITSFIAANSHQGDEGAGLTSLLEDSSLLNKLLDLVNSDKMALLVDAVPINLSLENPEREASVCCIINELSSLVGTLRSLERANDYPQIKVIYEKLASLLQQRLLNASPAIGEQRLHGWIKQCHFAMSKFLLSSTSLSEKDAVIRLFAVDLIGRLSLGDEAKAAILFSNDFIFATKESPSSVLPDMFMRELCGSDNGRKQLDHSFKLQRGFGITSDGYGPFSTESLLSGADRGPGGDSGLLPMGKSWLWQVLSGSLGTDATSGVAVEEVCKILGSGLSLLSCLEGDYVVASSTFNSVSPGGKLYFLLNIFLYPESILANRDTRSKASALLTTLLSLIGPSFATEYVQACFNHSRMKTAKMPDEDTPDPKDEKLLAVLSGMPDISSKALRMAQDFSLDLCNAYVEYGAQYDEFATAIRVLLMPQLPAKIRCEVLKRLREVSHLLVLEEEATNQNALISSIEPLLLEGIPPHGERDVAEVLDLLADILRQGQGGKDGFFFMYAAATLSRGLLGAVQSSSGLDAMKRRLLKLPRGVADVVLESCASEPTTRTALVKAVASAHITSGIANLTESLDKATLEDWLARSKK